MSEQHLAPAAIEAMAHDHPELVSADERSHAVSCASCAAAIESARTLSLATNAALQRVELPALDLDGMVARALDAQPAVRPLPQPSRRAFAFAAAAGILVAIGSAVAPGVSVASLASLASFANAPNVARTAVSIGHGISRVVAMKVPLGWTGLGSVALAVLVVVTFAFRSVLTGARWMGAEEASR